MKTYTEEEVKEICKFVAETLYHEYGIGFMGSTKFRNNFSDHPLSKRDFLKKYEEEKE